MDNEMQTCKSKENPIRLKLSFLNPKKSKNNTTKYREIPKSVGENYRNQDNGDSYPVVEIPIHHQQIVEQKTALVKDDYTSKHGLRKNRTTNKLDKDGSIKEIKSNNSESNIGSSVLDNYPNMSELLDQNYIDNNVEVIQKPVKRRRAVLQNSKKSRIVNHPQDNQIIAKQKIDGRQKSKLKYNDINLETSKFNDEDDTNSSESIVEQSKKRRKKKSDTKKTNTSNKGIQKELSNSESFIDLSCIHNGLEKSINEIDGIKEIDSNNLQTNIDTVIDNEPDHSKSRIDETINETDSENVKSKIDTVVDIGPKLSKSILEETKSNNLQAESYTIIDNGPELSKSHLNVDPNKNDRAGLKISKYCIECTNTTKSMLNHENYHNEDHKQQSIVDVSVIDKHTGLSKLNDTEKSEMNVDQSKTAKKINSDMHNAPETSLDEFNNSKSRTDTKISKYFFLSNTINDNNLNEKDLEQPQSIIVQKGKLRRKSISKSLVNESAIDANAEDNTEESQLNNIKTNTRKRLRSATIKRNDIFDVSDMYETQTSNSIEDLVNSKSSIVNSRSSTIDENNLNGKKRVSSRKSISKSGSAKLFDEKIKKKSHVNVKQSNKRGKPASNLKKIEKNQIKRSASIVRLSIEDLENVKSVSENDDSQQSVSENDDSQLIPKEPKKRGRTNSINNTNNNTKLKPGVKITKYLLKETSSRKIPQKRLEDALEMLKNKDHPIWEDQNVSCNTGIHRYWEPRNALLSDQNLKLKYARQFLLRRDWLNLSKVLCLSTIDTKQKTNYYPLLTKYATLCLAHTDKEQFNKFVQFLVGMDDASSSIMKKCRKILQKNEE